jgi:hypothetical protein
MSTNESHAGVVTCPACELHILVTDPNEAIEIYRRHKRVTDHEVEWERTSLNVTTSSTDTETVLTELADEYSEGVPIGVLSAALSAKGLAISEVLDELYSMRMEGKIYEPQEDHFLVL